MGFIILYYSSSHIFFLNFYMLQNTRLVQDLATIICEGPTTLLLLARCRVEP